MSNMYITRLVVETVLIDDSVGHMNQKGITISILKFHPVTKTRNRVKASKNQQIVIAALKLLAR